MTTALLVVLLNILFLYRWVVLIAVVVHWLVGFGVINPHNQIARAVIGVLYALTEPVFRRIRRVVPPFGGLDISPLIVFFAIYFLEVWVAGILRGGPIF